MNAIVNGASIEIRNPDKATERKLQNEIRQDFYFCEYKNCWIIKDYFKHNQIFINDFLKPKFFNGKEVYQMSIFETANKDRARATDDVLKRMFPGTIREVDEEEGTVLIDNTLFTFKDGSLRMLITCLVCNSQVYSKPIRRPSDVMEERFMKIEKHDCMDM